MKHTRIALAAAVLAASAASTTSTAVHAQGTWTEIDDDALVVEPLGMTVGDLDGVSVYDPSGERIGELDDILMGSDGTSMAASLDVGGFLGIGEKDVAIPIGDLMKSGDGFSVNMTQEQLEALPEFDD